MNKTKKSQLVFDPKMTRRLLKLNTEFKFCPYCGKELEAHCECHKNFVIDVKPYRADDGSIVADRSVFVFDNNTEFQADYNQMIEDLKAKRDAEEPEQISFDID